jgi:hypothetical protein
MVVCKAFASTKKRRAFPGRSAQAAPTNRFNTMKSSDLLHAVIVLVLAAAMFVAVLIGAQSTAQFAQHLKRISTPIPRPSVLTPAAIQMLA